MAKEIIIDLNLNAKDSVQTLGQLEDNLSKLKEEIKGVSVGSSEFKKLANEIRSTESQVKNLNKSFEGLDTEAIAGEMGKLAGGIGAAFAGIQLLAADADEDMQNLVKSVGGAIVAGNAIKGTIEAWTAAQKLLNVAMKANPIGLVIAGVAALTAGITLLVSKYKDAQVESSEFYKTQTNLNTAINTANANFAKESAELGVLNLRLKDTNISTEERNEIIGEINNKYKDYLPSLLSEKDTNEELADSIERVNEQMLARMQYTAVTQLLQDEITKITELRIQYDKLNEINTEFTKGGKSFETVLTDLGYTTEEYDKLIESLGDNYVKTGGSGVNLSNSLNAIDKNIEKLNKRNQVYLKQLGNIDIMQKKVSSSATELADSSKELSESEMFQDVSDEFEKTLYKNISLAEEFTNEYEDLMKYRLEREIKYENSSYLNKKYQAEREVKDINERMIILDEIERNKNIRIANLTRETEIKIAKGTIKNKQELKKEELKIERKYLETVLKEGGFTSTFTEEIKKNYYKKLNILDLQYWKKNDEVVTAANNRRVENEEYFQWVRAKLELENNDKLFQGRLQNNLTMLEVELGDARTYARKQSALWDDYLKQQFESGVISEEQYNNLLITNKEQLYEEIEYIEEDYRQRKVKAEIDAYAQIAEMALGIYSELNSAIMANTMQRMDDELHFFNEQKDAEIERVNETNEEIQNSNAYTENEKLRYAEETQNALQILEDEKEAKDLEIRRKQAQYEKENALFQIAIETLVASMKAAPNPIAIAGVIALGTASAIAVNMRELPKYAMGGLIEGDGTGTSDSIPAYVSNGESIINAKSTSQFSGLLSAINQSNGGAPIGQNNSGKLKLDDETIMMIGSIINDKKVINVATDTTGVSDKVYNTKKRAKLF